MDKIHLVVLVSPVVVGVLFLPFVILMHTRCVKCWCQVGERRKSVYRLVS